MSRLSSDFISGTYDSEIAVLNKGTIGKKSAKSQPWLVKKQKDTQKLTADQRLNFAIKNRCEVFSAWQYESFLGDGHTQPKYYLVQEPGEIDSIATKFVTGYTSFNLLMNKNTADAIEECSIDLQEFMTKRTAELRSAAIQNPDFLEFMKNHGENAYKEIKADLLDGCLANSRYFRTAPEEYKTKCLDELHFNFENLATEAKLATFEGANTEAITMLRMLRQFCESQYLRLKKVNETAFFKKGLSDKTILFKRLLDNIDATPFSELTPGGWTTVIEQLFKETAIVAHHRRYSKFNTFFRHTESTSWKDFTAIFSNYAGEYSSNVRAALATKSGRATVISERVTVSGYNDYLNAVKNP